MKSLLKASVGAIALMTGAGIAMAQDSGTAGTQQMASDITCAQIVTLDSDEMEQVLYFMAGYHAAQNQAGAASDTTAAAPGTSTDTTASADTSDSNAMSGTDTTASADTTDTDAMSGTDTTASADMTTEDPAAGAADTGTESMASDDTTATGTDTTTTAGTTASGSGSASAMLGGSGFFEIPVESVMTACENAPESRVSDTLQQQGGGTAQ